METRRPSFSFLFFFFYSLWFFNIKQHNRLLLFLKVADRKPSIQVEMAVAYFFFAIKNIVASPNKDIKWV